MALQGIGAQSDYLPPSHTISPFNYFKKIFLVLLYASDFLAILKMLENLIEMLIVS